MQQPLFTTEEWSRLQPQRVSDEAAQRKTNGVHYTPTEVGSFLARRVVSQLPQTRARVLDPACGDGELLVGAAEEAERAGLPAPYLVGVDRDPAAIRQAGERLGAVRAAGVELRCADFLARLRARKLTAATTVSPQSNNS
jgi:adenine-specific DNA-methyltransferase